MSDQSERLIALIHDYQRRVATAVAALRAKAGEEHLLAAWHAGKIEKVGTLDDRYESRFSFHGCGCGVISTDAELEFDFGPNGRCDGFDGWRLWIFAQSRKQDYAEFQRLEIVESVLGELVTDGVVARPHWEPSPHLCYWAAAAE